MAKVVSIIGAGPCGMAAARALTQEGFEVNIFDSRAEFGGVWLYDGKGPMYRDLNTNLQSSLMMFKDHKFDQSLPKFPDRKDVLDYVVNYSKEVAKANVKFNIKITTATKRSEKWSLIDRNGQEYTSDFLVVAAGHCEFPLYPPIRGLLTDDNRVTHSRYFNEPSPYKDKKVLIVGNASSAIDLAIHILPVADSISISRRRVGALDHMFEGLVEFVAEIEEITKSQVSLIDETSVAPDIILFCTGYLYSFPFLDDFNNHRDTPVLHPKRQRICNLYRNSFFLDDPTLAFIAMDKNIVPMPLSECQAAAIARVWSNRLELPHKAAMRELEAKKVLEKGDGSAFHSMKPPEDVEYMLGLVNWVSEAGPHGFTAERWSSDKIKERKNVAETKSKDIKRRLDEIKKGKVGS